MKFWREGSLEYVPAGDEPGCDRLRHDAAVPLEVISAEAELVAVTSTDALASVGRSCGEVTSSVAPGAGSDTLSD